MTPKRYGGHELGFETWFDVVREISKADCSHGWCASLICNHTHVLTQFTEEAQQAVWSNGPDLAITASVIPSTQAILTRDGYRVSGTNAFSSGIDHSAWLGNDRETIDREKAGIFRAGRPAVCSDPSPPTSLRQHAAGIGA